MKDEVMNAEEWIQTTKGYYPAKTVIAIESEAGDIVVMALFKDVEVDTVKVEFSCEGQMTIDTSGVSYLMFDDATLVLLGSLMKDAEKLHGELDQYLGEDLDYLNLPEEMITRPVQSPDMDERMKGMNAILCLAPFAL